MFFFRITTIGTFTNSCSKCWNLRDEVECADGYLQKGQSSMWEETNTSVLCTIKIPGLAIEAKTNNAKDKNLPPLSWVYPRTLPYRNTNIISVGTDHPDWAPGECLNIDKYVGQCIRKSRSNTQQVK